jgi:hypothetical protein
MGELDQGDAGRVSGALGFDVTRLIQRELFAQKEILCSERGGRTQPEHGVP